MKWIKMLLRILISALVGMVLVVGIFRIIVDIESSSKIFKLDNPPTGRVAIVFGAGLYRDGTPSPILRDRVATAANLFFSGKVEKILMSGDNRFAYYNEPGSMMEYAMQLGVPQDAIVLDYAGRRTYDTCYRAKVIFGVKSTLLVTQKFHLPRALFLCNALGLKASGVEAKNRQYWGGSLFVWNFREQLATVGAFLDVYVNSPIPVLGTPEPIFVD